MWTTYYTHMLSCFYTTHVTSMQINHHMHYCTNPFFSVVNIEYEIIWNNFVVFFKGLCEVTANEENIHSFGKLREAAIYVHQPIKKENI